jgi:hypothetical protein
MKSRIAAALQLLITTATIGSWSTADAQDLRPLDGFLADSDTIDESCIVLAGNRTANLRRDGTYSITGVPADQGPVRVLVQCAYTPATFGNFSPPVRFMRNQRAQIPSVPKLVPLPPLPVALVATPQTPSIQVGGTQQLTIEARGPRGDATNITQDAAYRTSNPQIVTVSDGGLLTGVTPGSAIIGVVYAGRVTVVQVNVTENFDRDGDGIPNDLELQLGLNPDDASDAMQDPDGDGLTTREEIDLGTEFDVADTDGDGINDGDEVRNGTNPLAFDTDGDGIGDGTDNCPLVQNPGQEDANRDGRGDACPAACTDANDCNDGNACTMDACGADSVCTNAAIPNCCAFDADCEDNDPCTADSCAPDGTCGHSEITGCCISNGDCNDGVQCTADTCDLVAHQCENAPLDRCCTQNSDCMDMNACTDGVCDTSTGRCAITAIAGCCNTAGDCDDGDSCTTDTCSGVGGTCMRQAITGCCTPATSCDDGAFCNGEEVCGGVRGCIPGAPTDCSDAFSCTTDMCDEATDSCVRTPSDQACDNGLFCDGTEVCDPTMGCRTAMARDCGDTVDCTMDGCDEMTDTCTHAPLDSMCNDSVSCNGTEICNAMTGCMAGQAPPICETPIVELRFDEGQGPTGIDTSGLRNHATLQNGTAWVSGVSGSAVDLDGVNDFLTTAYSGGTPAAWTIEAWVFDTRNFGVDRTIAAFDVQGRARFGMNRNSTLGLTGCGASTGVVPTGRWTHVAATHDGMAVRYYINGALEGTAACASPQWSVLYLGAAHSLDVTLWRGRFDEVRVFNTARSATQIADDAKALVLHMNEGMGTRAADSSSLGYHATINGATWTPSGFSMSALSFDGVDDVAVVPGFGSVDVSDSFTIELYIRRGLLGREQTVFSLGDAGRAGGFSLRLDADDDLIFSINGTGDVLTSANPIDDLTFHRVQLVHRGQAYVLLVDGVVEARATSPATLPATALALGIGARPDGSSPFQGVIDEFQITLAALDILPAEEIAHYLFNEGTGRTSSDSGPIGYHARLVNTATFAAGLSGSAIRFDGGGYVETDYPNMNLTSNWSFEAWIYDARGPGTNRTIVGVYRGDGNRALFLNAQNHLHFNPCPDGNTMVIPNQWVRIGVTYDGASVRYYINGQLDAAVACGRQPWDLIQIGGSAGGSFRFVGLIDEVTLSSGVLTPAQIAERASVLSLHLDDNRRTRAADSSGLLNDGRILNGATWTTGAVGPALELDGVDDVVDVPPSNALDLVEAFTIEARVRRSGPMNRTEHFIAKSDGSTAGGWRLSFNELNQVVFSITGSGDVVTSRTAIDDMMWHSVSVARAGELYRLFIDGMEQGSEVSAATPRPNNLSLTLGGDLSGGGRFMGALDEIRILRHAEPGSPLILRLRFDEGSGTRAADTSGRHFHGTLVGGATWGQGQTGTGLALDGVDDYVTTTYPAASDVLTTWTLEAWIQDTNPQASNRTILGVYNGDGNRAFFLNGQNRLHFNPCPQGSQFVPANQWVHVAMTYDGTNVRYYINGELDATVGCGRQPINFLSIGASAGGSFRFRGGIDEVKVYNTARTAAQIQESASLLNLHLDELAGARAGDRSGLNHHAVATGGPTWIAGQTGNALRFDGVDDVLTIADTAALDLSETFSIQAAVQRGTRGRMSETIVAKNDGSTAGAWSLAFNDLDQVTFVLNGAGTIVTGRTSVTDTAWHPIALVHRGEQYVLYVDGMEDGRASSLAVPAATSIPLTVGRAGNGTAPFQGAIDELRITAHDSPAQALTLRFRFDEGTGTTVADSSGNEFHGTLVGGPTFTAGQTGTAINFDGVNDQVTTVYPSAVNQPQTWTFEAWIYDTLREGRNRSIVGVYNGDGNRAFFLNAQNRLHFNPCPAGSAYVPADQWVHVAMTYDGMNVRYYINGQLDATVGCGRQPINFFSIGASAGGSFPFLGAIDEVAIHYEARTPEQIARSARLLSMSFDDRSNTLAQDASQLRNDGVVSGATWSAMGFSGGAFDFDGVDDVIRVADTPTLDLVDNFSVEARVRRGATLGTVQTLVAKSDGMTAGSWRLGLSATNRVVFEIVGTGAIITSVAAIADANWHRIALTHQGELYSLYIDDVLDSIVSSFEVPSPTMDPLTIGANSRSATAFDGMIDELFIAPYARPPSTLIARYRFNEGTGTTTMDSSGNSFDGTLGTGVTWVMGRSGNALNFASGSVTTTYPASRPTPARWTIEGWVFITGGTGSRAIVGVYNGDGNRSLFVNGTGRLHFNPCAQGNAVLLQNRWVHVAATYDGASVRYYINGALDSTVGCGAQPINHFRIGSGAGGSLPFVGMIDELRFYDTARSLQQIAADMNEP